MNADHDSPSGHFMHSMPQGHVCSFLRMKIFADHLVSGGSSRSPVVFGLPGACSGALEASCEAATASVLLRTARALAAKAREPCRDNKLSVNVA
jgi:malic enzyme